jgi:hypothetical protein
MDFAESAQIQKIFLSLSLSQPVCCLSHSDSVHLKVEQACFGLVRLCALVHLYFTLCCFISRYLLLLSCTFQCCQSQTDDDDDGRKDCLVQDEAQLVYEKCYQRC